jgi:hypothetical protein
MAGFWIATGGWILAVFGWLAAVVLYRKLEAANAVIFRRSRSMNHAERPL